MDLGGSFWLRRRPGLIFLKLFLLVLLLRSRPSPILHRRLAGESTTEIQARRYSPPTSPAFSTVMAQSRNQFMDTCGRVTHPSSREKFTDLSLQDLDSPFTSVEPPCLIFCNSEASNLPRSESDYLCTLSSRFKSGPDRHCFSRIVSSLALWTRELHCYYSLSSAIRSQLRKLRPRASTGTMFTPPVVRCSYSVRLFTHIGVVSRQFCFSKFRDRYGSFFPPFEFIMTILNPRVARLNVYGNDGVPEPSICFASFPGYKHLQFTLIPIRASSRLSAAILTGSDVQRLAGISSSTPPIATVSHRQICQNFLLVRTKAAKAKTAYQETLKLLVGRWPIFFKLLSLSGFVVEPNGPHLSELYFHNYLNYVMYYLISIFVMISLVLSSKLSSRLKTRESDTLYVVLV